VPYQALVIRKSAKLSQGLPLGTIKRFRLANFMRRRSTPPDSGDCTTPIDDSAEAVEAGVLVADVAALQVAASSSGLQSVGIVRTALPLQHHVQLLAEFLVCFG
jgi:hypothetical protein